LKLIPDAPLHVEAADLEPLLATGHAALVVFETPDCEPCRRLEPVLDTLARDYQGRVLVVRVDASAGWLAARHHLSYVPTLTFWEHGEEQARIRGNPGMAAVRAYLNYLVFGAERPEPANGARHALVATFATRAESERPRALLSCGAPKG
jgi:thioredoxin 1